MQTTNSRRRSRKSAKRYPPVAGALESQTREQNIKPAVYSTFQRKARFQYLLNLPESEDIARAINDAMRAIEEANSGLDGVLPKTYNRLERSVLFELLRTMSQIPMDIEGDAFGKIYEYFLGNFAMAEGQRGGEFLYPYFSGKANRRDSPTV